ncbi:MAG: hypothetical protein HGA78_11435 [Nitrospirales bacterium]|nr:hypothetical protein [Nitrospirales bacterium]
MIYYIHYVPGRMRIQTPYIQDHPNRARHFEADMGGVRGVVSVRTNPVTGSALILFHEQELDCEQLIGILEVKGYFSLVDSVTNDEYVEKATEKILDVAGKIVGASLGGEAPEV